jgi:cytochrome P450
MRHDPQRPPGPSNAVLQQLRYLKDPLGCFTELERRYGDPFFSPSFECDMVVTGRPEGLRAIFSADPSTFEPMSADILRIMFGPGTLVALSGEPHRAARKLQAPPFHGARMHSYAELIQRRTRARLDELPAGQPFVADALTQKISLDVIIEAVFGVSDAAWRERFHEAMRQFIQAIKPSFLIFKSLRHELGGMTAYARFLRAQQAARTMLADAIAARRAAPEERPDILGMLLAARYEDGAAIADTEVIDQLLTLVLAGHETTGTALQWALYELHREEGPLAKLRAELDGATLEALPRLPYLSAVCDETLRLWPLFPGVARKLTRPLQVSGYTVPAGQGVVAAIHLAHRRADLYPEPDRFLPERFIGRSYGPFEYLPFGGGARRCLGAAFAQMEMKIVLATLLAHARFRLVSPAPGKPMRVKQRNAAVGPRAPVRLLRE